jgi:aryl-alcohol dehydrogenase-like predicted oxidoreductase
VIERAPFGATGHDSSRVIFGAAALASVSKGDADRALEVLLEHGINHIDVAASYGDAELRALLRTTQDPRLYLSTPGVEASWRSAEERLPSPS